MVSERLRRRSHSEPLVSSFSRCLKGNTLTARGCKPADLLNTLEHCKGIACKQNQGLGPVERLE